MLQVYEPVEMIPAARRLMNSLRDMGYELTTAVADLVDNSVEASATRVNVDIEFEGENSWVRITDNGTGMTSRQLREAMRYGSSREYSQEDLGKFGLGLKVASLSQCQRLTVASRTNQSRADISAYCWDLAHIEATNRWELLPVSRQEYGPPVHALLKESPGTVVLWQRLDRILGYQDPGGESARRRLSSMCREVEGHLAMVFHRFLAGEVRGRRKLKILVNGFEIGPWDPFARNEPATKSLEPATIPVRVGETSGALTLEPFILPHQTDFSSSDSFRLASGPANWNQQQGFYVYRSDRLIQSGGWCRIRTLDEHTKLARVALRFSSQLDDAFRVNVSKMRVQLPPSVREQLVEAIAPVTRLANDTYRRMVGNRYALHPEGGTLNGGMKRNGAQQGVSKSPIRLTFEQAVKHLLSAAKGDERRIIKNVAARFRGP